MEEEEGKQQQQQPKKITIEEYDTEKKSLYIENARLRTNIGMLIEENKILINVIQKMDEYIKGLQRDYGIA